MEGLNEKQTAGREKTLLAALLLSMWAPLATGLAVFMSSSTTQLADFIRRSVELFSLFVSWWFFRCLKQQEKPDPREKAMLESVAGLGVAAALFCSAVVMLILAFSRAGVPAPGGNVYPGLAIAVLGLITNTWFWRRYTTYIREQFNPVIEAQRQLYRAKACVDLCIIIALGAVAVYPGHAATRYVDFTGSLIVAAYLLWSGFAALRTVIQNGLTVT